MSKIKIGWAEVDITPKQKISLAGQFFERISDTVESPLAVTAFALESGGEQLIICSCDLVSIAKNLNGLVKEKLKDKLPFSTDKVIINAIHTHTSYLYTAKNILPNTREYLNDMLPADMAYKSLTSGEECMSGDDALYFLADKISEAALAAWNNRGKGYYQNAFGRAVVGMNRRVRYDDDTAKMWGDTGLANFEELEGGNDSGIELIYTFDGGGKINGVIANIACPAQVVEHRSFISSDYFGKVREYLSKHFGKQIYVLGLVSAAGDQCPRDMIRWVNPETPIDDPNIKRNGYIERTADPSMFDVSGLKLVGKRISNEIIAVYESLGDKKSDEGLLIHETFDMTLPLRRVTITEYNDALEKINTYIEKNRGKRANFEDNARLHVYSGIVARYDIQQKIDNLSYETHIIRFGDIAIATNPFELFLDYGNKIRARSKAKQTFIIQLACGSGAYLPTKKAEMLGHYSAYVSSGVTGHQGGDILVRTTLEHINKMFG